jgi:hypothetical protein
MNYTFGDRSDEKSRAARIRSLFVVGSTIHEHAERCVEHGVWTESELRGMAAIQSRAEVRAALGQITPEGVPFAGPTETRKGRAPVWRQMEFWSKRDFDYNYSEYRRRERANGAAAMAIARVCRERFGDDPVYIEITGDGDADGEPV